MSATGHPGEKLSAYLDDELSPAERAAVEQHLRECASCAQLLEDLAAVDTVSRSLAVQAPEGYFDAFPGRLRERLAARRSRRIPAWTWAAAAAVLLAVLTPLSLRDRPSAPATAEMKPPVRTAAGDRPAQEESSLRRQRTEAAAATGAPPATTLAVPASAAELKEKLGALGYVGEAPAGPEAKEGEFRQKRDAAQDDRLRERDADAGASGAGVVGGVVGGVGGGRAGPAPRGADLKDAELKKEAFGEKGAADKRNQNVAPATPVPASVVAAQAPELAARADESAASLQRAEPQKQSPAVARPPQQTSGGDQPAAPVPPAAEAPSAQGYAAKPRPGEGALGATKAAGTPKGVVSADEAGFAEEFAALASRPVRKAEDARTAAREWSELARRHPQAQAADEARLRAIEALATAWRMGRKVADRDQARKDAQAYLAAAGPQKDRVRAVLDQLAR